MDYKVYKGLNYIENIEFDKYIDTGIGVSSTLEVDMKYNLTGSLHETLTMTFGARYAALVDAFIFFPRVGDNQLYIHYGDKEKSIPLEHESFNTDYRVVMGNNTLKFYNNSGLLLDHDYSDLGVTSFNRNDITVALFAARGDFGYTLCSAKMKLYYCKIKKDGNLVRDLIPMKRLSDGACGLFDKVSKTFFISSTGNINDFTGDENDIYYSDEGIELGVDNISKIEYVIETKNLMKQALIDKGSEISDTDTFRSYVDKINNLSTENLDTSDATATKYDILNPQTAYIQGRKVTGAIQTEESEDPIISRVFKLTYVKSSEADFIIDYRIKKNILIYYTDTEIGLFDINEPETITKYAFADLELDDVTAVDISSDDKRIIISNDTTHKVYLLNGLDINLEAGCAEITHSYLNFNEYYTNMAVGATGTYSSSTGYTHLYMFDEDALTYTTKQILGGSWYRVGKTTPQGPFISNYNDWYESGWTIHKLDTTGTSYLRAVIGNTSYKPDLLLGSSDGEYINFSKGSTHNFRKLSVSHVDTYRTFTHSVASMGYHSSGEYVYFVNADRLDVYNIESNKITFSIVADFDPSKTCYYDNGEKLISLVKGEFKICDSYEITQYLSLSRIDHTYYNPYKENADVNEVLSSKLFINSQGRQTGTMPNNGELVYNPSDAEQIIPAGYTSGGKVSATDITTLNDYLLCDTLAQIILGENIKYRPLEYITFAGTQYFDTGIALWSKENWRMEYTFDISKKFNYNHLWSLTDGAEAWESWVYSSGEYCRRLNGKKVTVDTLTTNTKYVFSHQYSDVNALSPDLNLIFGRRYGTSDGIFKGKLYSVKMWVDDVLVRNFIPVIDLDGVKAMYDLVEQKFYYSANEPFI